MVLTFLVMLAFLAYAILTEIEGGQEPEFRVAGDCTGCRRPVEPEWLLCPRCRTLLRENCADCDRSTATYHAFCPWCGRKRKEKAA
ncbi:zinc ribbon domain-containing protein [Desulfuromonas sp. TF]|jgi:RNA polymerase subunit RPABC4/transcription elongation factor Spt4|uniref:zinc ribbon domain-containing protein n=1 Tax=Desulfuromonas sp. TF TaxID=1232410 RepID=UPI0004120B81|nr:zinc ribbon domain-containing protein [Desulfuromonas sp. TF]